MASNSSPHHSGNSSAKFSKVGVHEAKIAPKDLSIVWGNDNRYWSVPNSSNMPAELYQVSWLEVSGAVDGASAKKSYQVVFHVSLNPDAFGWGNYPIYIMIKRGQEEKIAWTKISINPTQKGDFEIKGKLLKSHQPAASNDSKLCFGLYEVWSGKWKGGLKIHSAYVNEISI